MPGAAADESDGLVACHLQALHQAQRHEMTYMEGICGRVKAYIECCLAVVDKIFYLFLICHLRNQSAGNQFFINTHLHFLLYIICFIYYPLSCFPQALPHIR